jgi:hypothetical protein
MGLFAGKANNLLQKSWQSSVIISKPALFDPDFKTLYSSSLKFSYNRDFFAPYGQHQVLPCLLKIYVILPLSPT